MSCGTLSAQLVGLNVSMASLPEGFCPTSEQERANAIAARLVVSPNQASSSFAIGSIPPTSNVGPWFKDCETWFKFDDATATYIPVTKGGFDNLQYFSESGDFVVPPFIYKLKIQAIGGGGGGHTGGGSSSGGGGGSYGLAIRDVLPGQIIPIMVGAGGPGGNPGTSGSPTTVLGMTAGGGGGAVGLIIPGVGGTAVGFDANFTGQTGEGDPGGGSTHGGIGGSAAGWGGGGGMAGNAASVNGVAPGGGGAGSTPSAEAGGAGAAGGVLIEW